MRSRIGAIAVVKKVLALSVIDWPASALGFRSASAPGHEVQWAALAANSLIEDVLRESSQVQSAAKKGLQCSAFRGER